MIKDKIPTIQTRRLFLRAIEDKDADAVVAILMDPLVSKTYMVPEYTCRADAMKTFEALKRLSVLPSRFVYGICLEERLIGFINDVDIRDGEIELGFAIHPAYHGNGYATEVLDAAIRALLCQGYRVVKTGAFAENAASIRVMEKCAMTRLVQTETIAYRGTLHQCVMFEKRQNAL